MGLLDDLLGKKKPMSDEQKRERYMMSKYQLTKDPQEPLTYWINDQKFIQFNPNDPASVQKAEEMLIEYYRNPQIQQATRDKQMLRSPASAGGRAPAPAKGRAGKDEWKDLKEIGAGFAGVSDYFTQGINQNPNMDDMLMDPFKGKKKQ
jgi:hypothetical protein